MHWSGVERGFNVMVMDLQGPSLEQLFNFCGNKFTLNTLQNLALQMISRAEAIHKCGYVHRDFKPQNFLIGTGNQN